MEKKKMFDLVGSAEAILFHIKHRSEEDKLETDHARTRLDKERVAFASEKKALLDLLMQDKVDYAKERDAWAVDKTRFHQNLLEEKRDVDIHRNLLASKLQAVASLQEELEYEKRREESAENAFNTMMRDEMAEVKIKRAELDRDLVALKLEKLKFQVSRYKSANFYI
jgi:hypothetical protein